MLLGPWRTPEEISKTVLHQAYSLVKILVRAQMADSKQRMGREFYQAVWQFRQLLKHFQDTHVFFHVSLKPENTQTYILHNTQTLYTYINCVKRPSFCGSWKLDATSNQIPLKSVQWEDVRQSSCTLIHIPDLRASFKKKKTGRFY